MEQQDPVFDEDMLLEMVDNQLADGQPRQAKEALLRLSMTGHSQDEAKALIACALGAEIMAMQASGQPFNMEQYLDNLAQLPAMPWDDD